MNSADHFEALVSEHYEPLYRFAMSLTRTESDAQDLTQQTFYVWATKGHQLRDRSRVKPWLFTTLHRAFLESRRRQTRFPHHELDEVEAQLPTLTPAFADRVDSAQVLSALAEVDEVFQPAVALFYLEDCPYKDIALILDVPIGTVKSRIARGIAQLREILGVGRFPGFISPCGRNLLMADTDQATAPLESTRPRPCRQAQLTVGATVGGFEKWDSSATRIQEQFGGE